jgi:flagellar hook-associated protein 3 FlgL
MRIATSTIYDNQTNTIDNLSAQYQQIGQQLSSGKSLQKPSDDPAVVSQDLTLTNTISAENNDASNATSAQHTLTFTDSTLSSLTTVLQTARSLCVEGATDIIPNGSQRPLIGKQVEGLLEQAIGLANSQYGDTYVFAGTGPRTSAPVTPIGTPPSSVAFTGNLNATTEIINGVTVQTGTTLQQAFNYKSTDGSPDVFTLLATLRDTLDKEPAAVQSGQPINVNGATIYGAGSPAPTTLGQITAGNLTQVPLTPDDATSAPAGTTYYSIRIDGTPGGATITFNNNTAVDDGTPTSVVGLINAQSGVTGVTAAWNVQQQRLQLTSTAANSPPFEVTDVPTAAPPATGAAATKASTFLEAFKIPNQISVTENLSTQLYNIDAVINSVLAGRAQVGQQIQNLAATTSQLQSQSTDNKVTQSAYEDTNVAEATSQFSLVQTALQAAYATTNRLENKSLLDYISGTGS